MIGIFIFSLVTFIFCTHPDNKKIAAGRHKKFLFQFLCFFIPEYTFTHGIVKYTVDPLAPYVGPGDWKITF
jgi:hypothetical protein